MNGVQIGLFDEDDNPTHREAFEAYHAAHPDVLDEFVRLAFVGLASRPRIGSRLILERIRWTYYIERDADDFKINNNHAPYYARAAIARHPELEGRIEVRRLRTP